MRQCEILCENWKIRYRNVRFFERKIMVMSVYLVLMFSSGLNGKRLGAISAPVVPAHQKQMLTPKKSVKLLDKIIT
jgi:hypothetical protein